jgi:D-erythro-7,8-dihydroneopterin triphosphate epimerase
MTIHIKNLRLRTIIGIQDWERRVQQDVIINIKLDYDGQNAAKTDDIADTVDYKALKRKVIDLVENSQCGLLDRLVHEITALMMEDSRVQRARVEVDKPHALRFADSVSITCTAERDPSGNQVRII